MRMVERRLGERTTPRGPHWGALYGYSLSGIAAMTQKVMDELEKAGAISTGWESEDGGNLGADAAIFAATYPTSVYRVNALQRMVLGLAG
jgi:hypothetical protein